MILENAKTMLYSDGEPDFELVREIKALAEDIRGKASHEDIMSLPKVYYRKDLDKEDNQK